MATALEERIVQRGHRIYDLIEGQAPSLFKKGYWTTKMMDWAMRDEAFKTEMFRFVEALLHDSTAARVGALFQLLVQDTTAQDFGLPSSAIRLRM